MDGQAVEDGLGGACVFAFEESIVELVAYDQIADITRERVMGQVVPDAVRVEVPDKGLEFGGQGDGGRVDVPVELIEKARLEDLVSQQRPDYMHDGEGEGEPGHDVEGHGAPVPGARGPDARGCFHGSS